MSGSLYRYSCDHWHDTEAEKCPVCRLGHLRAFGATDGIADLIGAHLGREGAIVGTGLSLEGFAFEGLRNLVTIGLNESCKLFAPDYLVLNDTRAVMKSYLNISPDTELVMSTTAARWARSKPLPKNPNLVAVAGHPEQPVGPFLADARRIYTADFLHGGGQGPLDPERQLFYHCGILTAALSLACALGLKSVRLYGCDMYRYAERQYAYDISPAAPTTLKEIPDLPGLYSTPSFENMAKVVRRNQHAWQELDVVNYSKHSQIGCFATADDALKGTYQ